MVMHFIQHVLSTLIAPTWPPAATQSPCRPQPSVRMYHVSSLKYTTNFASRPIHKTTPALLALAFARTQLCLCGIFSFALLLSHFIYCFILRKKYQM